MVYLRNERLRWSVAAEEKEAEPLISHSIELERIFDPELLPSSMAIERERES